MNLPAIAQPNWWSRNWTWFVPVLAVALALLFAAAIAGFLALVMGMVKSSEPYQQAMARAQAEPAVSAALGEPIADGWFVQGNININGSSGDASLAIPVRGPNGDGKIYVDAVRAAGAWEYRTLIVELDDGQRRIDLGDKALDQATALLESERPQ
ncbi:cytochrome c oxidase assembly factor 1 family protein [Pseudoxanthomonas wuyuanensis]